jgi:hypothetical protein
MEESKQGGAAQSGNFLKKELDGADSLIIKI